MSEVVRWIISVVMVIPVMSLLSRNIISVVLGCIWMIVLVIIVFVAMELKRENTELLDTIEELQNE